jgi:hypothetical protein
MLKLRSLTEDVSRRRKAEGGRWKAEVKMKEDSYSKLKYGIPEKK